MWFSRIFILILAHYSRDNAALVCSITLPPEVCSGIQIARFWRFLHLLARKCVNIMNHKNTNDNDDMMTIIIFHMNFIIIIYILKRLPPLPRPLTPEEWILGCFWMAFGDLWCHLGWSPLVPASLWDHMGSTGSVRAPK